MIKLEEIQADLRETYELGNGWGVCANFTKMRCVVDGKLCPYDYVNHDEPVKQPHVECFEELEIPETYFAALIQWANRK